MKISLEWISDFVDLPADLSVADLAHELTLKTVEVEDFVEVGAPLRGVVVARVDGLEPIGGKGHLLATCETGTQGPVRIVTRTKGLSVGQFVPVALVGARLRLPGGEVTAEVARIEIAGAASEGVICTAADLGLQRLFPHSRGDQVFDLGSVGAEVGVPLAEALGYDDVVLEIDNKSLTNRPDLWGHYGIARELATIYDRELKPLPRPARPARVDHLIGDLDLEVCRRMTALEFSLDGAGTAPLWMRSRLARIGESTVNLCVDLSNYVMFTVGQPNHVYDADHLALPLSVARSSSTAKLELLTGESREVEAATPVIRDATATVALAGIMGGSSTAVSMDSRRFVVEIATFRPTVIRRASQHLGVRTEASARFEKGLDTQRVDAAADFFLEVLAQVAPTAEVTGIQDVDVDPTPSASVELDMGFLTTRIGQRLEVAEVRRTLGSLGFTVSLDGERLHVTAPTWRSTGDISLPHDIVEEVARVHGYDSLPVAPLSVALRPVRGLNRRPLDRVLREQLASRAGLREVITYPWVADSALVAAGLDKAGTVRFEGAPAPDRNALRPSLVPNLLEAIVANLRYRESFDLFEVGTVFHAGELASYHGLFEPLPPQRTMVGAVFVGMDGAALFRRAKGALEMLRRQCHLVDLRFSDAEDAPAWADRSARLVLSADGAPAGALGLLTKRCRRLMGLDDVQVACFELDISRLSMHQSRENRYEAIPYLPEADFDLSVVVTDRIRWSDVDASARMGHELISRVSYLDEFRGSWVPDGHKSVTLRVTLRPTSTTLTAEDIAAARAGVLAVLEREVGAHLRD